MFCDCLMGHSPQFIGVVSIRLFVPIKASLKAKQPFKKNLAKSWWRHVLT